MTDEAQETVQARIQKHSFNFQTLITEISILRLLQKHHASKQKTSVVILTPPNANITFLPVECIIDTVLELSPRLTQEAAASLVRAEQQEPIHSPTRIFHETIPFPTKRDATATTLFLYLPPKRNNVKESTTTSNTLASAIEYAYSRNHSDVIAINYSTLLQDAVTLHKVILYCNNRPKPPVLILFGNTNPTDKIAAYIANKTPKWEFQSIFQSGLRACTHRMSYIKTNSPPDARHLLNGIQATWRTILNDAHVPSLVRLVGTDFFRCNTDVLIVFAGDSRDIRMQQHFPEYETWRKSNENTKGGEWKPLREHHQRFPFLPLLIRVLADPTDMQELQSVLTAYYKQQNHTIALYPMDIPGKQDYDTLQSTRLMHSIAQTIVDNNQPLLQRGKRGNWTPRWFPRLQPTALTSGPAQTFAIGTRVSAPRRIFLADMQPKTPRSRWAETTGMDVRFIELVLSNTLITLIDLFFLVTGE